MNDIQIRMLNDTDHPEWLRMRLALWPDNSHETMLAEMQEILEDPTIAVIVAARQGDTLGGFLEVGTRLYAEGCESSPVGYIEGWWVDDDLRRKGVGAALVRAAEDWSRRMGYREIASDCLLENEISLEAHLALDYEEVERLIHFRKSLE